MQVLEIKKINWANDRKSAVSLIADTDEGSNLEITTPYSSESIIWDKIKEYPVDLIEEYVEPVAPSIEETMSGLSDEQKKLLIEVLLSSMMK